MKKTFTKQYLIDNRGCYELSKVEALICINNESITLEALFDELTIRDFCWWLLKKCDLTKSQKDSFSVHCAEQVLPFYGAKLPNYSMVIGCLEATHRFQSAETTIEDTQAKIKAGAFNYDTATYVAAANVVYTAENSVAYRQSIWEFVLNIE